jgi:hypothetical protein
MSEPFYEANQDADKTKKFTTRSGLLRMLDQKTVGLLRIPLAVAVGFEPTVEFPQHTLSRRAPLAARTRHQA